MGLKIERRWLVRQLNESLFPKNFDDIIDMRQGYMGTANPLTTLRVRIPNNGQSSLTLKRGSGLARPEIPGDIPRELAEAILNDVCLHWITKTRYKIDGWEFDVFREPLTGVLFLEREFKEGEDVENIRLPIWVKDAIEVTDSLTSYHLARLATSLRNSGRDPLPYIDQHLAGGIRRKVITGAPCSGKSSAIEKLKLEFPDIQFVPEVASIILGQVGIYPGNDAVSLRNFQNAIWRTQKIFEQTSIEFAISEGKRLVVFDRGTVDNAAYLPGGLEEMETLFRTTVKSEYGNYDEVICLCVPPQDVYEAKKSNNPNRKETYQEALALERAIRAVWSKHPNLTVIENGQSWKDKLAAIKRHLV